MLLVARWIKWLKQENKRKKAPAGPDSLELGKNKGCGCEGKTQAELGPISQKRLTDNLGGEDRTLSSPRGDHAGKAGA